MDKIEVEPLKDFLLIKITRQDKTEGGILIPEASQGVARALVVKAGPEATIPVGSYVLPGPQSLMFHLDVEHVFIRQEDILAVDRRESVSAQVIAVDLAQPRPRQKRRAGGFA